jgi:endonuclease III
MTPAPAKEQARASSRSTTRKSKAVKRAPGGKPAKPTRAAKPAKTRKSTKSAKPEAPAKPSPELKRRARQINNRLKQAYPDARCSLDHRTPLELLIATILSAQCTDERVNLVTPELFRRFPTAGDYAGASLAEIAALIHSTGFFNNKAKSIQGATRRIVDTFGGRVPDTMEELLTLPGVARKTANVVLGNAYGKASGVVVDTHVHRITRLLGLTREGDPKKIELDLMALLPSSEWVGWSHRLIQHGRQVCIARRPRCGECVVATLCPSAEIPVPVGADRRSGHSSPAKAKGARPRKPSSAIR